MASAQRESDAELDGLLDRLVSLADEGGSTVRRGTQPADGTRRGAVVRGEEIAKADDLDVVNGPGARSGGFFPLAPRSLADVHISESEVEAIVLRCLMHCGTMQGVEISQQISLPFSVVDQVLKRSRPSACWHTRTRRR